MLMRALILGFVAVMWFCRTADPLVHSLLHDHHAHCSEEGVHLHEADELCVWSDPATFQATPASSLVWTWVSVARASSAPTPCSSEVFEEYEHAVPARGPPCLV